jgi:4-amino-4-deoxy-L-arabinose transferase-like glycosyltransferase
MSIHRDALPFYVRWMILALLMVMIVLCTFQYMERGYWLDELLTQEMGEKSVGDIFISLQNSHCSPPLCFLLLHYFQAIGSDEWVGRLPSLLFALGSVLYAFALGRHLGGERVAVWTAIFAATAPLLIRYGAEARMYAHFVFFTTASLYYVARLLSRPDGSDPDAPPGDDRFRVWGPLFIMMLGGLLSHYFFCFLIVPLGAIIPFGLYRVRRAGSGQSRMMATLSSAGSLALLVLLLSICYLPYLFYVQERLLNLNEGSNAGGDPVVMEDIGPAYCMRIISPAVLGYTYDPDAVKPEQQRPWRTLTVFVFIAFGAFSLCRKHRVFGPVLLAALLFTLFVGGFYLIGRNKFEYRFFIFQVPFYALFLAYAVVCVGDWIGRTTHKRLPARPAATLVFILSFLVAGFVVQQRLYAYPSLFSLPEGWKQVGEALLKYGGPDDSIMIHGPRSESERSRYAFEHYEVRYPLRHSPMLARVGYLPDDLDTLKYAITRPGNSWIAQVHKTPWPASVRELIESEFSLFVAGRRCSLWRRIPRQLHPFYVSSLRIGEEEAQAMPPILIRPREGARRTLEHTRESIELLPGGSLEFTLDIGHPLPLLLLADVFSYQANSGYLELYIDNELMTRLHPQRNRAWTEVRNDCDMILGATTTRIVLVSRINGIAAVSNIRVAADSKATLNLIQHPRKVVFGGKIEFLGFDISPYHPFCPGETFTVDYYWRATDKIEEDLSLIVRMDARDPSNPRRWKRIRNGHRGFYGMIPTSDWKPGRIMRERYRVRVPDGHPDGIYAMHMNVVKSTMMGSFHPDYPYGHHAYQHINDKGERSYVAGALEVSKDRNSIFRLYGLRPKEQRIQHEFRDKVTLHSYQMHVRKESGQRSVILNIIVRCEAPMTENYRFVITLTPPEAPPLLQRVARPYRGFYPTTVWERGEILKIDFEIPFEAASSVHEAALTLQMAPATPVQDKRGYILGEPLGKPKLLGIVKLGGN